MITDEVRRILGENNMTDVNEMMVNWNASLETWTEIAL